MTVIGLGATYRNLFSLSVEDLSDTERLVRIVQLGGTGRGIDVIDLFRIYLSEIQRVPNRPNTGVPGGQR